MNGARGMLLDIDLSSGTSESRPLQESTLRLYLGGGALGAKLLLRRGVARADALSPENLLIIAPGVATGAAVSGVSRCSVVSLSPLTGAVAESQAGGMLGPALKRAGYDAVVIRGRAASPVWLRIDGERVTIEDASPLSGRTTSEVFERLEEMLGGNWTVLQCGPAGERLVRFACLLSGRNDVFGRTGLGAVFGAKNLRAVAVHGSNQVPFADVDTLRSLARRASERLGGSSFPATLHEHGTPGIVDFQAEAGNLATRNHASGFHPRHHLLSGQHFEAELGAGATTCFGCVVRCRRRVRNRQHDISDALGGPEFETLGMLGSNLDITDAAAVARANQLCGELGLDTITTGALLAWLAECRQRGLISPDQLDGLDFGFGQAEPARELIARIGRRRGVGDVLAEGFAAAIEKFGPATAAYAVHTKGQGFAVHLPQVKPSQALLYAASPIGPDHMSCEHDWLLEAGGDDCLGLGISGSGDRYSTGPAKVRMTVQSQIYYSLLDSLCLCMFCWGPGNLFSYNEVAELVQAATGWGVTFHELMKAGERRLHLMRVINARRGLGRQQDRLPPRMFEPLHDGPSAGRRVDPDEFEKMLDLYYVMLGCDPASGHPTSGKLHELGLEWVLAED